MGCQQLNKYTMKTSDINTVYYFAYGHNTQSEAMKHRCPGAELIGTAILKNFQLSFKHFSNIENHDGASITGVLWKISDDDLQALDDDEGLHSHYNRIPVEVHTKKKAYRATTYIMDPLYDPHSVPEKSYIRNVASGYAEHGIPLAQISDALHDAKDSIA